MSFFNAAALESQCHMVKGSEANTIKAQKPSIFLCFGIAGHAMSYLMLTPWKSDLFDGDLFLIGIDNGLYLPNECWYDILCNIPDNIVVYTHIVMDELITHTCHLTP